jgi:hypothetical protein
MLFTLILGGITHHYMAPNLNYCNLINDSGTIKNEYAIAMVGDRDAKIGAIKGKDSACGDIFGVIGSIRVSEQIDFMIGGYNTNVRAFEERDMVPPTVGGVTPVLGLNFKIPLYKNGDTAVEINNLISIGIITHAISFTF